MLHAYRASRLSELILAQVQYVLALFQFMLSSSLALKATRLSCTGLLSIVRSAAFHQIISCVHIYYRQMGVVLEIAANHEQASDAFTHRCSQLFGRTGTDVPCSEYPWQGGFELLVG